MNYEIIPLPKDRWKGTAIPLVTRSDSYYDFELSPLNGEGCTVSIVRKTAEKEIVHTPEEYDSLIPFTRIIGRGRKPTVL